MFVGNPDDPTGEDWKAPTNESEKEQGVKVSNLVSDGVKLNEKYDDAWYLKHNPQHWNNVRTMGLLSELTKNDDDPIANINPTLYKHVQAHKSDGNFTDPFHKIMD